MASFKRVLVGVLASGLFAVCSQAVFAHKVDVDIKCEGGHHDAKVVLKWSHEGHDRTIEVRHGESTQETLEVPDHSKLEIRTEGGRDTKYDIKVVVAHKGEFRIVFDHGERKFDSHGEVDIDHTSGPSETGESDVRVHIK